MERKLLTPNNLAIIGTVVILIIFVGLLRLFEENLRLGSQVEDANLELEKSSTRFVEFAEATEKKLSFQQDSLQTVIDSLKAVIAKPGKNSGRSFLPKRELEAIPSKPQRNKSSPDYDLGDGLNKGKAAQASPRNKRLEPKLGGSSTGTR